MTFKPFAMPVISAVAISSTLALMSMPAYAACNVPKSYYSNVFCTASSSYYLALKDSGEPVAILNKQGKRVFDLFKYDAVDVNKLKDGIFPVQKLGKVGYVNMSGREVVPTIYDPIVADEYTTGWSRAIHNGRIIVKKNGGFGIIDAKNLIILPFSSRYKTITDYNAGTAKIIKQDGSTLWIDSNARKIANPNAEVEPKAKPAAAKPTQSKPKPDSAASKAAQSIDNTPVQSSPLTTAAYPEIWQPEKRDGKWGFINSNGVPMIKFTFEQVTPFSEDLAGVRMDGKWGFVNLAGELVVPFVFDEADVKRSDEPYQGVEPFVFKDGKAWVGNTEVGAKMCASFEGRYVACSSSVKGSDKE